MTIAFHCPYCTAPIEVEDAAAGKTGRCPRCATHLTVPRPPEMPQPPTATPPAPSTVAETAAPPIETPPAPELFAGPPLGQLPSVPTSPLPSGSVARRVKRRARGGGRWVMPLVFGGALLGIVGWLTWSRWEWDSLSGEIPGATVELIELPPVVVSCAGSGLPQRQLDGLLEDLQAEPVPLLSDLMQVQIRGSDAGLSIAVQPGPKTVWYRVDPNSHRGLSKYLARHGSSLNERRQAAVHQARDDFLALMVRIQANQESVAALAPYRDALALPASVFGLGYHVVAAVGRQLYPCARETGDGTLYFLLPPGLKEFELIGKELPDGTTPFPGQFTIAIRESITVDAPPATEPEPQPTDSPPPESTAPPPATSPSPDPAATAVEAE